MTLKYRIFFKNLVRKYGSTGDTDNIGASEECRDAELCSHGDWPAVKGPPGGVLFFGNGHMNVIFSQTTCPIQFKLGMRHQGNGASIGCALILHPPIPKAMVNNRGAPPEPPSSGYPQIRHFFKINIVNLPDRMH